jgi:uncharacterized protein (TIGR00369 family)
MEVPIPVPDEPNSCFGCGPSNEQGLQLQFVQVGEHAVECRWTAPAHVCGSPGVVHGGIQAAALDETLGYAVRTVVGGGRSIVTVELSVTYRRPVPAGVPLVIRAWVEDVQLPDLELAAQIVDPRDDEGRALTRATARWKVLD